MSNLIKKHLSSKSIKRHFIDFNLFMMFIVVINYLIEPIQGYTTTKNVINIWMIVIGTYLVVELIKASVKEYFQSLVSIDLVINAYFKYVKGLSREKLDAHNKKFVLANIVVITVLLILLLKAYLLLMATILLIAFYIIVIANKRYENIKRKIDDLF